MATLNSLYIDGDTQVNNEKVVAVPCQQRLREDATILPYMYIAYLVFI
jgi:hypothetical protein